MEPAGSVEDNGPVVWCCVALAAAAGALMIAIAGVYANAVVSAGDVLRADCGTVWDPAAVNDACDDALNQRTWIAFALLGFGLLGATGAVLAAGRWPRRFGRPLAALAVVIGAGVVAAGLAWGGVIDRSSGT